MLDPVAVTDVAKPKDLYLDSDGVRRGYYVYVHKDRATDAVFYVGKGHGRRAWEAQSRNDLWNSNVASLPSGWDVDIVQDDLGEIDALELEAELVEKYGGAAATGGILTNWVPGGENPPSIRIDFQFSDHGWHDAYYKFRTFKNLSRYQQETIAVSAENALQPISEVLSELDEGADQDDIDKLAESIFDVDYLITDIIDASVEFQSRRISWQDFGIAMEEGVDGLESELETIEDLHPKIRALLRQAVELVKPLFVAIDSGNRKHAEESADRKIDQT